MSYHHNPSSYLTFEDNILPKYVDSEAPDVSNFNEFIDSDPQVSSHAMSSSWDPVPSPVALPPLVSGAGSPTIYTLDGSDYLSSEWSFCRYSQASSTQPSDYPMDAGYPSDVQQRTSLEPCGVVGQSGGYAGGLAASAFDPIQNHDPSPYEHHGGGSGGPQEAGYFVQRVARREHYSHRAAAAAKPYQRLTASPSSPPYDCNEFVYGSHAAVAAAAMPASACDPLADFPAAINEHDFISPQLTVHSPQYSDTAFVSNDMFQSYMNDGREHRCPTCGRGKFTSITPQS